MKPGQLFRLMPNLERQYRFLYTCRTMGKLKTAGNMLVCYETVSSTQDKETQVLCSELRDFQRNIVLA